MSAKGKVEFILTADDAKAVQAATKLLEKVRETGAQFDQTGRKQKTMFDELAGGATKFVTQFGTIAGVSKIVTDALDQVKQRIDAIVQAQGKAAEVSKSYGEAMGRVAVNMPGVSPEELRRVDELIRKTAGGRGLGEGGLIKLADAYAQIQSAIPLAPESTKAEALGQTAKLLELVPTENASAVGLGVAKIMENGPGLTGNQALNLLRQQQTLGLVKDVGPIGEGIPALGAASKLAGVGLPEMQALAAYMTQAMGDTGGAETISAISGMTSKIMTRGATITDKMGLNSEITGNLFERLQQISEGYQAGTMTEDEIGKLLPDLTRSEKGKMAILGLLGGGMDKLGEYRRLMTSPETMAGDFTTADLGTLRSVMPAQEYQGLRRSLESATEAKRAADVESAQSVFYREEFQKELKSRRRGMVYEFGGNMLYESRKLMGDSELEARALGKAGAELSRIPLFGIMATGAMTADAQMKSFMQEYLGTKGFDPVGALYKAAALHATARRPLKETGAR